MKAAMSAVSSFLLPFVKIFLSSIGPALASAATTAVAATAQNMLGASGEEKRQAAFQAIISDLKKQGIEATALMINSAIEAAVAKLYAK